MRAQPDKRLERDDGSTPDKCPLGSTNVLLVEIFGEIESQEDGPYDGKWPHIGVHVQRKRPQQLGVVDLSIVDERCHGGG